VNFVDRTTELAFLEEKWRWPQAQFNILGGKKRVDSTKRVKHRKKRRAYIYLLEEVTRTQKQMFYFSAYSEKSIIRAALRLFNPAIGLPERDNHWKQ
jgi:hypothetical protein